MRSVDEGASRAWEEVGHVYLCDVKGDKFPHEEIREKKRLLHSLIARNDSEGEICLECPALKVQDWPHKNYLVDKITLNTWLHLQSEVQVLFRCPSRFHA